MVRDIAEKMRLGNIAETLVRSELEKHGWIVYGASGEENVGIDMIAVKWINENRLILKAIQVKSRKGFGTKYPTVMWSRIDKDKNLFYIAALPLLSGKWVFYVVPTDEVQTIGLNIKMDGKYKKYRDNWKILES